MSKNESRKERLNQEDNQSRGINKVYYWIIGILFLVLIILIVFIFSRSGNDVNLENEEDQSGLVEEEDVTEAPEEDTTDASEDTSEEAESSEDTEDTTEEDTESEEDTNATEEETEEEAEEENSSGVNEDAPHDPNYTVNYNSGSADRVEIKERVMEATGLDDDLIEEWVGNNGPGQVVATVSSRDRSESYEVYLQYGDGSWHVTGVD